MAKKASPAADKLKIVMFLGSVREGRLADRVGKFVETELQSRYDITVFDPAKLDIPMLVKPMHHYKDPKEAPQVLRDCDAKLREADAFLVVTCEYNHSVPPALSNLLDHFGSSAYSYKPSGIICYSPGIYGGMRAAMQLRCLLSELGTLSVSNIFGIPQVQKSIDEDGKPINDHMVSGLNRLIAQLDWHAKAMKNHRDGHGLPK